MATSTSKLTAALFTAETAKSAERAELDTRQARESGAIFPLSDLRRRRRHPRRVGTDERYDAIIIGSGFGGAMVARQLVDAGARVLMLERGDWVARGPDNWGPRSSMEMTEHYSKESAYQVSAGAYGSDLGGTYCVGGPSVFYGGVALRFRERDFHPPEDIVGESDAAWPLGYGDLERHYGQAERLLHVSGCDAGDPTAPPRTGDYPQPPAPLANISERIATAARDLGMNPSRLPVAINYTNGGSRAACQSCGTCDTFACAVSAKNDLATTVIPDLLRRGLELRTGHVVVDLVEQNGRVGAVACYDKNLGEHVVYRADTVVLSAGALASAHLLLASGLPARNPGGHVVGRYLMRHCNAMVFGCFPKPPCPEPEFHKQLLIQDFYFGDEERRRAPGKLGCIQQVSTPPLELVKTHLPFGTKTVIGSFVRRLTGLLCIAEDQPREDNGVDLTDDGERDPFGLPRARVHHTYSRRDLAARAALVRRAKQVLRRSGAWAFHTHKVKTFSHAVGTVRMGSDPTTSALDEMCRFRGVNNLFVVDGSFMPSAAGVNPSLTISANALRVGEHLVREVLG